MEVTKRSRRHSEDLHPPAHNQTLLSTHMSMDTPKNLVQEVHIFWANRILKNRCFVLLFVDLHNTQKLGPVKPLLCRLCKVTIACLAMSSRSILTFRCHLTFQYFTSDIYTNNFDIRFINYMFRYFDYMITLDHKFARIRLILVMQRESPNRDPCRHWK